MYRRIKQMITEKKKHPNTWHNYTITEMETRADEVLAEAFLHIPVEHFEAIEEIKQQLNLKA